MASGRSACVPGVLGCSLPLLGERGFARSTGLVGLISGGLPLGFPTLARADLEPPLLIMILSVQSVWNLAAAALLLRGVPLRDAPEALSHAA